MIKNFEDKLDITRAKYYARKMDITKCLYDLKLISDDKCEESQRNSVIEFTNIVKNMSQNTRIEFSNWLNKWGNN